MEKKPHNRIYLLYSLHALLFKKKNLKTETACPKHYLIETEPGIETLKNKYYGVTKCNVHVTTVALMSKTVKHKH